MLVLAEVMHVGLDKINELRKKQHLTIEDLSIKSGVPLSTVKKICAGITTNPNLDWVKQQIRNATPYNHKPKYLIHDNDAVFVCEEFKTFLSDSGIKSKRTSYYSPWQNGIAERVNGIIRQELTNHIIPINEAHLYRVLKEYIKVNI